MGKEDRKYSTDTGFLCNNTWCDGLGVQGREKICCIVHKPIEFMYLRAHLLW
jgi:hypothetical protein